MPRNGLTREKVVEAAVSLIEQSGCAEFSMRALADRLNVKTASLYNHVESHEALMVAVCAYALQMQCDQEMQAIDQKAGSAAIHALANAYREFAKEHRALYRLIMNTAAVCGDSLSEISQCIVEPFLKVLQHVALSESEKNHWQRVLRGIVHGFVSQEESGFFSHLSEDVDVSFQTAVECYIVGLNHAEKRKMS